MRSLRVHFPSSSGSSSPTALAGHLELPDDSPKAFGLYANCFTCTRQLKLSTLLCRALAENGIAMLRFNFRGLGDSQGKFADSNLATQIADIRAATRFLSEQYSAPELLIGHSLGGAALLQALPDIRSARALVTISTPSQPVHLLDHFPKAVEQLDRGEPEVEISVGPMRYRVNQDFLKALRERDGLKAASDCQLPWLIMHSPQDDTVAYQDSLALLEHAAGPASLMSLDQINHLVTDSNDIRYLTELIQTWASRPLGLTQ